MSYVFALMYHQLIQTHTQEVLMNNQQMNRKQLEKAIQQKLKKSGKNPAPTPAPTQPTSLLSKTSTQTQNGLPPLEKLPLSRRAPSPEPDADRPITTFLEPIKPKKPLKPKKAVIARPITKRHIPDSYYMAYPLIGRCLLWIFMNPQRYIDYASQATEKQSRALTSAQQTTLTLLWFIFLLIPIGAVVFGIFPGNPKAIQNGFVLEHWFVSIIGLCFINIILAPFPLAEGVYSDGLLNQAIRVLLRIPLIIFLIGMTIGATWVTFFLTTDINLMDNYIGIAMVTVVASICLVFFMMTYAGFIFGDEYKNSGRRNYRNPMEQAFASAMYAFQDFLQDFMESSIRAGKPTLINMLLFAFLIGIYGFVIWVYFFNGWQVVDTWLLNCMC